MSNPRLYYINKFEIYVCFMHASEEIEMCILYIKNDVHKMYYTIFNLHFWCLTYIQITTNLFNKFISSVSYIPMSAAWVMVVVKVSNDKIGYWAIMQLKNIQEYTFLWKIGVQQKY